MPTQVVDLAARSRVFRDQRLLSHAWVTTPAEVLEFLRHPRSELKKLGIRLPSDCGVETILQNHDWLSGRSHGLTDKRRITVFARGEGDGKRFYRVSFFASKARKDQAHPELLHRTDEEVRPGRQISTWARWRAEATWRSAQADPLHLSVHEWLAPITLNLPGTKSPEEAHRIFSDILGVARRLVEERPSMGSAVEDIASNLQRPFNPDYGELFNALGPRGLPFHRAFAGVMYARAIWWLRASQLQRDAMIESIVEWGEDPEPTFRVLAEAIESLDRDFVAHAVVAASIRRQDDDFLDARLSEAESLFQTFDPDHAHDSPGFADHARGLERFLPPNSSEWWFLPGLVAFAVSTWSAPRGPLETLELT